MAVPTAYLTTTRNLKPILEAMQRAGVPARVTYDFLKQLGYASSSDRPVLAVLKALGFLAESGEPTDRYRRYKEPATASRVMAEAIRDAYADVFTIDQTAQRRTATDLKGMFARLTDKGEAVTEKMAMTFKALADLADFNVAPAEIPATIEEQGDTTPATETKQTSEQPQGSLVVHHDVHIHLPLSTDIAVYDAIFRSLRESLM